MYYSVVPLRFVAINHHYTYTDKHRIRLAGKSHTGDVHERAPEDDGERTCTSATMRTYAHTGGVAMRLNNTRDLGLYVRDRRRRLGVTQADLAASAQVSRRWLSDLEAGKPTAEVGLVFKVLHALDVTLDASPVQWGPGDINLDDLLRPRGQTDGEETGRGR